MNIRFLHLLLLSLILLILSCTPFAPPSPLVTYGGPKTTPLKHHEMALALGTGAALFEGAHAGGHGWFSRYKYGFTHKFDFGIDAVGLVRNGKSSFSTKLVGRYSPGERIRFESGFGIADDSDAKSLNGDLALTIGTVRDGVWNYYMSARLGVAKGYPKAGFLSNDKAPPDAIFPLINIGTQAKITETQRFVLKGEWAV